MTMEQSVSMAVEQRTDKAGFLQNVLRANGVFSALSGLLFLFNSSYVAAFLGLESTTATTVLMALGIDLLLWAGFAFWTSTHMPMKRWAVFTVIGGDVIWVVGSIILLLSGWLTLSTGGYWAVAIVADIVALFAILQFWGWRRLTQG